MTSVNTIDRTKFDRKGMCICSWNGNARKWFCAWWPDQDADGAPSAAGEGDDPAAAFIAMIIDLGALEPGATIQ